MLCFVAIFFLIGCNKPQEKSKHNRGPKVVEAKGKSIPASRLVKPLVTTIDFKKLKIIHAGKPLTKPEPVITKRLGYVETVVAGNPKITVPGSDTFTLPKSFPAINIPFPVKNPQPVVAANLWMKDHSSKNLKYMDVDHGMSSLYIMSALQDSRGYIWFGTDGGGVSRYDGVMFKHYSINEGLCEGMILSIVEDKKGNLWFGSWGGGVTKYDGRCFTNYTKMEGLGGDYIRGMNKDKKGNIWFAISEVGLTCYDGKNFKLFTQKEGLLSNLIVSIMEDRHGNIWVATQDKGVFKYNGRSFLNYSAQEGLGSNSISCMVEDDKGNIWFGTEGNGATRFDGRRFYHYTQNSGLPDNYLCCILNDRDGNLWFGTQNGGVCKFNGSSFTNFTETEGLSNNEVYTALQDNAGNIWFCTFGGGVTRYNGDQFTFYTEKQGLSSDIVCTIVEDTKGRHWYGTHGNGLSVYNDTTISYYTTKQGLASDFIFSGISDKQGNLWFGTNGDGVSKFDGTNFTNFSTDDGLAGNRIYTIMEDKAGNIWFGTENGACYYDGHAFICYRKQQGLCSSNVSKIIQDRSGRIWIGSDKGVTVLKDSAVTIFTEKEGLSHKYVLSIYEDTKGNIWFGTHGRGVCKYDGRSFYHYGTEEGLSHNYIWSIAEDHRHNIWFGSEKGLNCLASERNQATNIKTNYLTNTSSLEFTALHKEDGLKSENFSLNCVLHDSKNKLVWGGGKGITMLDIDAFKGTKTSPIVVLDNIILEDHFVDFNYLKTADSAENTIDEEILSQVRFEGMSDFHNIPQHLELPYNLNHLTFCFNAIDWYAPHKVKYQTKLVGADNDWSPLNSNNRADYRNLSPGRYTFKIKAIGSAGIWSNTFEYSFVIHPPWWKTWWAFCLYGIMAILSVIFIVWRYSRLLRARASLLKRRVLEATNEIKEQKNLIEEKHKEIKDSINYAERIQRSLLASEDLLHNNLKEHFIFFRPKDVVSGDFYWASKINNGNFVLVTADSTGHGVPGAIMSILNISCLEKAVEVGRLTAPDEILNYTREKIIAILKRDGSAEGGRDGMDCSVLSFDLERKILTWAAANNKVWVVRDMQVSAPVLLELKADKMPVGKHEKDSTPFTARSFQLQPGDAVYTFTDGYTDQFGGDEGKKFMKKRLQTVLLSIAHEPMNIQLQKVESEFNTWKGKIEQVDDVTVIGVRV